MTRIGGILAAGLLAAATLGISAQAKPLPPLVLEHDSSFYIPGEYVDSPEGKVPDGAMYVHALIPAKRTHKYPLVMIHGINSTGSIFEGTPDGREGWAQFFVRAGYAVYVVDQPARGRSPYFPEIDGPIPAPAESRIQTLEEGYTAPEVYNKYPRAHLHTQWPSDSPLKGRAGDPVFDAFISSSVRSIPTATGVSERLTKRAGALLLDRIGPAILLTHSQGGAFGWQITDARPNLVKGIIAIEPAATPTYPPSGSSAPAYGITGTPITYAPPITDAKQLARAAQDKPDAPGLKRCYLQAEPVHGLPTLQGRPIAIVVSEASPLADRIHCVSDYLKQAGVPNDFIRLENVGIHGNSHEMMVERNSDRIARYLAGWLAQHRL
ncbi:MAG TPA: alpha/beta hydrolase [Stellaceae bacterium]|jgi:pimeloyl-ACP methyl ester carboxylesterase|nr:alpha/beta hydrolase [Stellaceae bacterium]